MYVRPMLWSTQRANLHNVQSTTWPMLQQMLIIDQPWTREEITKITQALTPLPGRDRPKTSLALGLIPTKTRSHCDLEIMQTETTKNVRTSGQPKFHMLFTKSNPFAPLLRNLTHNRTPILPASSNGD